MISCQLNGGICNALFQIAFIETIAKKYDQSVYYPNYDQWIEYLKTASTWTTHAEEYRTVFEKIDFHKNRDMSPVYSRIRNIGFRHEVLSPHAGDHFVGYFQSYKYLPEPRELRAMFEPTERVDDAMRKYWDLIELRLCSLHVRRGNYLSLPNHHPVLGMDYYEKAMERIPDIDYFLVFSNDIEWCKSSFKGDKFIFIQDVDYVELFLGSLCEHHIIANSSFSAWMAFLGEYPITTTVAPKTWFGSAYPPDMADDIVPPHWIKI